MTAMHDLLQKHAMEQVRERGGSKGAGQVLGYLASVMDFDTRRVKRFQATIATKVGLTRETVNRRLRWLKEADLVYDLNEGLQRKAAHTYVIKMDLSWSTAFNPVAEEKPLRPLTIAQEIAAEPPRSAFKLGKAVKNKQRIKACNICNDYTDGIEPYRGWMVNFDAGMRGFCDHHKGVAVAMARSGQFTGEGDLPEDDRTAGRWQRQHLLNTVSKAAAKAKEPG